jgi:probable F420-dependent oxidoreductase
LQIGCHLTCHGPLANRESLLRLAPRLEEMGYDSLWASNHVVLPYDIPPYPYTPNIGTPYQETGMPLPEVEVNLLEPTTTLSLVSAVTSRVRLGTTTVAIPTRHPVLLAKTLANLDHLSNGRLILGAGAGWIPQEIAIFGVPWKRRGAYFDEAVRVMRACWNGRVDGFQGEFVNFDDEVAVYPRPTNGTIPIWIGGHSPAAIRRAVRLGDGWHPSYLPASEVAAGMKSLAEECERQGRDVAEIVTAARCQFELHEKPLGAGRKLMQGSRDEVLADLAAYQEAGVYKVILDGPGQERDNLDDVLRAFETMANDIRPRL